VSSAADRGAEGEFCAETGAVRGYRQTNQTLTAASELVSVSTPRVAMPLVGDEPAGHGDATERPGRLNPESSPARERPRATRPHTPSPNAVPERGRLRYPTRQTITRGAAPVAAELTIARWIEAFNARDLDALLAWTHPNVDFHPLWLSGLRRTYRGHDGIRCRVAGLQVWRHQHRINLLEVSRAGDGQLLAVGTLSHKPSANPTPFCALHQLADELIITAHHHMSDPDSLLALSPPSPAQP